MDLRARLSLMPPGSLVPAEWVLAELAREQGGEAHPRPAGADLTVEQVAERMDRRPGTVRNWIRAGDLDAYLFRGKEYRVTEQALARFVQQQRGGQQKETATEEADLGAWRKHLKKAG